MMGPLQPKPLNSLKAAVLLADYGTFKEFGKDIGYGQSRVSSVLNGHAFPSANFQRRAAKALGMTMAEFRKVLTGE